MLDFREVIMNESMFFSVLAGCAAALLGLMFVAISIEVGRRGKMSRIEDSVIYETLMEFMLPLVFSLAFISWPQYWKYFGCGLGIVGILGAIRTLSRWKEARTTWERFQTKLSIFSLCFYGAFVAFSWLGWLSLVQIWLIWLLFSGTAESWRILVAGIEKP